MRSNLHPRSRIAAVAAGATLMFSLAACGGGGGSSQVASLSGESASSETGSTVAVDVQQQWIDFAQCMRDNGVDMQDPTFDADGNVQGGGFGPDSGLDPRADDTRTAMTACSDLLPAGGPGGAGGPQFDRTGIQEAFTSFTACLRDEGLEVDDIDFSAGPGGGGAGGPPAAGDLPPADGDGGFQGGPPPDQAGGNGQGFDPTARIIEQLGLDTNDPAVTAAVDACSSTLEGAFGANGAAPATTESGQ